MSRTIGILTSGGDAPGMNAAIRSVARSALARGYKVIGIRRGYQGLIEGDMFEIGPRDVSDIMHKGGTSLFTARSTDFVTLEGQKLAKKRCDEAGIDSLICIGGDGTFRGALDLYKLGVKCVGIPATIDNDIQCTEYTIGFDTAMNTALEMIDKIKDTEMSHNRCSVVEVMGRHAGHIAVNVGAATGAIEVVTPEREYDINAICGRIAYLKSTGKQHFLVIVAEGVGNSEQIAQQIEAKTGVTSRATILGHVQRGGSPSCWDRVVATKMGYYAIELLATGAENRVVAMRNGKLVDYDIVEALGMKKRYDERLHTLLGELAI